MVLLSTRLESTPAVRDSQGPPNPHRLCAPTLIAAAERHRPEDHCRTRPPTSVFHLFMIGRRTQPSALPHRGVKPSPNVFQHRATERREARRCPWRSCSFSEGRSWPDPILPGKTTSRASTPGDGGERCDRVTRICMMAS